MKQKCAVRVYLNSTPKKYSNRVGFRVLAYANPETDPIGTQQVAHKFPNLKDAQRCRIAVYGIALKHVFTVTKPLNCQLNLVAVSHDMPQYTDISVKRLHIVAPRHCGS